MGSFQHPSAWARIPIAKIEDLSDAVYGAGLEATQMASGLVTGGLAFSQNKGVVYSSGLINGQVALSGPLSIDKVTLGVGLRIGPGSWHWLNEVSTGDIGVFHPGEQHDSMYMPGSLYATATLSLDHLEEEAARQDLVLDRRTLGGTGFHKHHLPDGLVRRLRRRFELIHAGTGSGYENAGELLLRAVINHFGRVPSAQNRHDNTNAHARIVARARAYIVEHLSEPMSLDELASAAFASRRTLQRAFADILDDTPQTYVRRLRLHRIRRDLASDEERACTIALVANQWGISELGRMSGWYRELFGERPSDTVAQAPESQRPALNTLRSG